MRGRSCVSGSGGVVQVSHEPRQAPCRSGAPAFFDVRIAALRAWRPRRRIRLPDHSEDSQLGQPGCGFGVTPNSGPAPLGDVVTAWRGGTDRGSGPVRLCEPPVCRQVRHDPLRPLMLAPPVLGRGPLNRAPRRPLQLLDVQPVRRPALVRQPLHERQGVRGPGHEVAAGRPARLTVKARHGYRTAARSAWTSAPRTICSGRTVTDTGRSLNQAVPTTLMPCTVRPLSRPTYS
jgi:hypothetical protein